MVGQQRVRPTLGVGAGSDELGLANRGGCQVRINVRIVEKPEDELLPQEPAHREVNALLGDPALSTSCNDEFGTRLAAELVAAGIQDHLYPRQLIQDAPRPRPGPASAGPGWWRPSRVPSRCRRCRRTPASPRNRSVMIPLLKAKATSSYSSAHRHPVVGHDLSGACGDGRAKWFQVVFEVIARIYLFPAVREMRILTVLLRPATGKMLRHRRYGFRS